MSVLPPEPFQSPMIESRTGLCARPWQQYFLALRERIGGNLSVTIGELANQEDSFLSTDQLSVPAATGAGEHFLEPMPHGNREMFHVELPGWEPQQDVMLATLQAKLEALEYQVALELTTQALLAEVLRRLMTLFPVDSGWSVTNVTPTKSFDANTVTLPELADVVGTLLNALKTPGVLTA